MISEEQMRVYEAISNKEHPAPPAIPEEVREQLDWYVEVISEYISGEMEPEFQPAARRRLQAIERWLASVPVATDKVKCPECEEYEIDTNLRQVTGWCETCCQHFTISPPRTKGSDDAGR